MVTISLCMIVRDEEEVLRRCLESVKGIVDEIIVVDTGSVDETKKIAEEYGAKIYDFQWVDDFSAARNYAFSKGTKEYLLWLDADDVVLENDRLKFLALKEQLSEKPVDVVMMKYHLGVNSEGDPLLSFYRERLVRRENDFKWIEPIHEHLQIFGDMMLSDVCITHKKNKERSERNLRILEKYLSGKSEEELRPRDYYYYGRELQHLGYAEKASKMLEKFLSMPCNHPSYYLDACIDLYKCYKKMDMENEAIKALLKSFENHLPRAEVCCMLGQHFREKQKIDLAIFWYKLCLTLEVPRDLTFVQPDCYKFLPYIQLSLCYILQKDYKKAFHYNQLASKIKPSHAAVLKNSLLLKHLLS